MAVITTIDKAHAALADTLWWLRGFEAATTSEHDDTVRGPWVGLREVRHYLDSLTSGSIRRLGDEQAVVLTYAEFEAVFDALRGVPTDLDRRTGETVVRRILDQYATERTAAREVDELPF